MHPCCEALLFNFQPSPFSGGSLLGFENLSGPERGSCMGHKAKVVACDILRAT